MRTIFSKYLNVEHQRHLVNMVCSFLHYESTDMFNHRKKWISISLHNSGHVNAILFHQCCQSKVSTYQTSCSRTLRKKDWYTELSPYYLLSFTRPLDLWAAEAENYFLQRYNQKLLQCSLEEYS